MSMVNPTIFERIWSWLKWKPVYISLVLIAAGILVWWSLTAFQTHQANKRIEQAKANVANALQQVASANATVTQDKQSEGAAVQQFKDAVNDYTTAVNATEQQRVITNQAIANYQNTVANKGNVNASAEDVLKTLDKLNQ